MDRRRVLKEIALFLGYALGVTSSARRTIAESHGHEREPPQPGARKWATRAVRQGDEEALVTIMRASVADAGSFNGQCAPLEWTLDWAHWVIEVHPAAVVVEYEERVVAFLDLPPRKPSDPSPEVERNQLAFWCGAGGVRSDLLTREETLGVFRELLYQTFFQARELGFEYVRCAAPWEQHPSLPTPFTEYPGVTITSFTADGGELRYLIEWRLDDAMIALAGERGDVDFS